MTGMRERVRAALERGEGVLLEPGIPARKLANARAVCRIRDGEDVIGLVDLTVFGSSKYAVVFADRIYIVDSWTTSVVIVFYDQLAAFDDTADVVQLGTITTPRRNLPKRVLDLLAAVRDAVATPPEVPAATREADPDDIGAHPDAIELQAAIAAAPTDDAPQLVLADLLLGVEDPRGELIILDNRERNGGLGDVEALERYLLLAAEYSFPRIEPEPVTLPFYGFQRDTVRYTLMHGSTSYDVQYRGGLLTVGVDGRAPLEWRLTLDKRDSWTRDEEVVILRLISDVIRAGAPMRLMRFPFHAQALPIYDAGPLRCFALPKDFTKPRGIAMTRYGLAARDYRRWMELHIRLAQLQKRMTRS